MHADKTSRIRPVRREVDELDDSQIEKLMEFGRREADVIDGLIGAARDEDRDQVWKLALALVDIEDQVENVGNQQHGEQPAARP